MDADQRSMSDVSGEDVNVEDLPPVEMGSMNDAAEKDMEMNAEYNDTEVVNDETVEMDYAMDSVPIERVAEGAELDVESHEHEMLLNARKRELEDPEFDDDAKVMRLAGLVSIDKEAVGMEVRVVADACATLGFSPRLDAFADARHHQFVPFWTVRDNVFDKRWTNEMKIWANPPWSLLGRVLDKIVNDKVVLLLVAPVWPRAKWWGTLMRIVVDSYLCPQRCFIDDGGALRPSPRWRCRVWLVDGALQ
jgi:hypothetical protein